jgi:hypothetical protein
MSQLSKANFWTAIQALYSDALASKATTRANHRTAHEDVKDSAMFIDDNFIDEDDMASDSATKAPSQQSVKAFVNSQVVPEYYVASVFNTTAWSGGNNSIYGSYYLGLISNNKTFQVELTIELIQDSATAGATGVSSKIISSFRKNNSGTIVQIGSTTALFTHNDTGETISANTLTYSTNIQWTFTITGSKTYTAKTYTKVTLF